MLDSGRARLLTLKEGFSCLHLERALDVVTSETEFGMIAFVTLLQLRIISGT